MSRALSPATGALDSCVVERRRLNQCSSIDTSLPRSARGTRIRQSFGRVASSILCWAAAFVRKGVFTGWEEAFTHSVENSSCQRNVSSLHATLGRYTIERDKADSKRF